MQLKRIALALGIPEPEAPREVNREALREMTAAGLGMMEGRPDDPMLDFLDL